MKKNISILFFLLFTAFACQSQSRFMYADSLSMTGQNPRLKSYILSNKIKQVTVEKYSKYYDKTFEFRLFQTYQYDTLGNILKVIWHSGKYATTMDSMVYDNILKTQIIYSGYSSPNSIRSKSITYYINDTLEENRTYKDSVFAYYDKIIYNDKKRLVLSEFSAFETPKTKTCYRYFYNANGLPSRVERKDSTDNFKDLYLFEYGFYKNKRITTVYRLGRGKKEISCIATYNRFNQCTKFQQWLVSKLSSTTTFEYNNDGSLYQASKKSENVHDSQRMENLRFNYFKD